MQHTPTNLAASIMSSIQTGARNSVFLGVQDGRPVLTFGNYRAKNVRYRIYLESNGESIQIQDSDGKDFALLLDTAGGDRQLRLALFLGKGNLPAVSYDPGNGEGAPRGLIQIIALQDDRARCAIIHAVFDGAGNNSLVIDSGDSLIKHLSVCSALVSEV